MNYVIHNPVLLVGRSNQFYWDRHRVCLKLGEGPSEPAYRSRFQTTFGGCGPKAMVVSAEGKGLAVTGSGIRQEEDCKGITVEVSKAIR